MQKSEVSIEFFDCADHPKIKRLFAQNKIVFVSDIFKDCLGELFEITHPSFKPGDDPFAKTRDKFFRLWEAKGSFKDQGVWVYYSWSKILVHFPPKEIFNQLRTSRNRNLITPKEQKTLQEKCVGIAGMSIGSNILNTLVLIGGPHHIKIADMDSISVPNLNRIMAPVSAVGMNKAVYFARRSLEVDPFLKIDIFPNGLSEDIFNDFFKEPKLDLFIEETDDPYLKIQTRKFARKNKIPVIMAADNGDGALIDVERYDLRPDYPYFHGKLDKILDLDKVQKDISFSQRLAIIANIVGLEQATPRAQKSLLEVGTKLNTWPQLGTAALICGVTLTFIARRILLGLSMPSGRYSLGLEDCLVPGYNSSHNRRKRKLFTIKTIRKFRAMQKSLEKKASSS